MSLTSKMDSRLYPGYHKNWDDEKFRQFILAELDREFTVLDIGAGAGIVPQMNFKGLARHVCGLDPDMRVGKNLYLDDGRVGFGESIPWPDSTFDLVISDNVLEHLTDPEKVFAEVYRVLKPNGVFLAKTPNKWHYVPLIARLTPLWFHRKVVSWRGRKGEDVFPTQYRANTRGDISLHASRARLNLERIEFIDGRPEYLRFSFPTYILGFIYERLVNRIDALRYFRVVLMVKLRKSGMPQNDKESS
jgi:SAM-dependent methyltransferase